MPVNTTNDYITSSELDMVIEASRGLKIFGDGTPKALDRIKSAGFEMAAAAAPKSTVKSIQGGFEFKVKGNRNQRHRWYHGSKKLKFEHHATPFNFKFYVGKGQFGNMTLNDALERAGIFVKLSTEIREGAVPHDMQTVIFNVLKEERDDIEYAAKFDLARRFWTANTDETDCFFGMETLYPSTGNTAGNFGGVSRTNPLARHQLITGVTGDNVRTALEQMERLIGDAGGETKAYIAGDNWFDMLSLLFQGSTTLAGKMEIQVPYGSGNEKKITVGLGKDSFVGPNGILITRDQMFRKLDALENPAVLYANRLYALDFDSLFVLPERHNEFVNHGMPYDQMVNYSSLFNSLCIAGNNPAAQGLLLM
jgi:hypothetical protein